MEKTNQPKEKNSRKGMRLRGPGLGVVEQKKLIFGGEMTEKQARKSLGEMWEKREAEKPFQYKER